MAPFTRRSCWLLSRARYAGGMAARCREQACNFRPGRATHPTHVRPNHHRPRRAFRRSPASLAAARQPAVFLQAHICPSRCFDNNPAAIFAASDRELDSVPIFQARHLATLRKPEFMATERQLTWFQRYGVRLLLP